MRRGINSKLCLRPDGALSGYASAENEREREGQRMPRVSLILRGAERCFEKGEDADKDVRGCARMRMLSKATARRKSGE